MTLLEIGQHCGGLLEINEKTRLLHDLKAARVQVGSMDLSKIPRIVNLKIGVASFMVSIEV